MFKLLPTNSLAKMSSRVGNQTNKKKVALPTCNTLLIESTVQKCIN